MEREAVFIKAVRAPTGRHGGALSGVRPDDLAAHVIRAMGSLPIDDVIFGCANQAGEDNRNVARMAALLAGLPVTIPGVTVNRLCGSGLEAIAQAARAIIAGEGDIFIAGGVEAMSRAPWVFPKAASAFPFGNVTAYDTALGWRFPNPKMAVLFPLESMGETAENISEKFKISRQAQDQFALESHQKAWAAAQAGRFKDEIVPLTLPRVPCLTHGTACSTVYRAGLPAGLPSPRYSGERGDRRSGEGFIFEIDETIRADTSLEKLSQLKPVFRKDGTVTAGNSSSLNDGAAALLVMSSAKVKELGLKPLARWVASAVVGCDPMFMGLGPVHATRKLLDKTGVKLSEIGLIELNEAFAVQALACIKELGLNPNIVNVNGGAIALGHPLGATGARLTTTLIHEMARRRLRYGLVTMCIGVGQGIAALIESA
ncbi:MAG: thiolase family protein [Elusimicrobia bacterium]|nr:thiolase family protein [Elusimicrobiota bacterium]